MEQRSKKREGGREVGKKGRKEEERKEGRTKGKRKKKSLQHQVHYTAMISCVSGTGKSLCQTNLDPVNENYFLFRETVPHVDC